MCQVSGPVCYQCGAPGGNECQLCPTCRAARISRRHQLSHKDVLEGTAPNRFGGRLPYVILATTVIMIGFLFYFVLFSSYGPGIALSQGEKAYALCMRRIGGEMNRAGSSAQAANSPFGAQFGKMMASALTVGICEGIKEECNRAPRGESCQSFLKTTKSRRRCPRSLGLF